MVQNQPEEKWSITRTRYIPAVHPLLSFFDWSCAQHFGLESSGHIINAWEKGNYFAVWEVAKKKEFGEHIFRKLVGLTDLSLLRAASTQSGRRLVAYCKQYALQSEDITYEKHLTFLEGLSRVYGDLIRDNMCYWLLGSEKVEQEIRASLKGFLEDQKTEIIRVCARPSEKIFSQIVEGKREELFSLARTYGISDVRFQTALRAFSEEYFWFPYEYVGPTIWDEETVLRMVQDELRRSSVSPSTFVEQETFFALGLSEETKHLFSLLQMLAVLQDDRKMFNAEVSYYLNTIIAQRVAKTFSLSFEDARYLDKEGLCLLKKDRGDFERSLRERRDFFLVDQIDGDYISREGEEAREYLKDLRVHLREEIGAHVKNVKGQIACRGHIIGKARVLKTSQCEDFVEGDVIVTGMTTPDFISLMKRAGAIVTDEGGVTCHAAIIARELRKPCIIGTKHATSIIKDGDRIEVNADTGIVTILK